MLSDRPFTQATPTLAVTLLLVGLRSASASAAPPTAAIRYLAPPECPGASTFLALLEDRAAGAWKVRVGNGEPDLVVEIRDASTGKVGRVLRPGRAAEGTREIAAADCRELVQALALSTALSLDEKPEAAAPAATVARATVLPATTTERAGWIAGGGVQTTFLFPSQPMPEASLFLESGRRSWSTGPALGRPDVRLAVAHARNDLFGGGRARFTLTSADLTICPASLGFAMTIGLRLCAAGDLGLLSGEGLSVITPRTNRFLWAAAGAVVRLRWAPGRRLVIEAQAGFAAPLERTTFIFEMPRVEVARVSAVVASGGLMLGLAVP